jgi:hypothetical protein
MKYLQDGSHSHQPLMRLSLSLTLVLLVGFWVTNFAMFFSRMGLAPSSVVAYYNGSEADFTPARSAASMLETTHMHLPMMGLVLLLLTHLLIFVPLRGPWKRALIVGVFLFALMSEGGGWLVRFVSPSLAPVKVVGFLGLQALLAALLVALGMSLRRPRSLPATNGASGARRASGALHAVPMSRNEVASTVAEQR